MSESGSVTRFVEAAGVRLRVLLDGDGGGGDEARPTIVLHGFTGSVESMADVAAPLASDRRVARLEFVGHGESDAPETLAAYAMESVALQIVAVAEALDFVRPSLVAYSMGGRAALFAATERPAFFSSLVLVGATAGIEDPELRCERIRADEALADRIEREGVEAFVDHWMALPIFASQARLGGAALAAARKDRLRHSAKGLADSLRGMGAGAQPPVFGRLDRFQGRAKLVAGEEDQKFRDLAMRLASGLPQGSTEVIPGVGHAAHLESPTKFAAVAREFLAESDTLELGRKGIEQ